MTETEYIIDEQEVLAVDKYSKGTIVRYHVNFVNYLSLNAEDGIVQNDDTDKESITVNVVDGLEVARGTDPSEATVLNYDGDLKLSVDGQHTTKTFTNGSVEFDISTDKPAGSEVEIVAESLADHPAESDSAIIEVVSQ